jgi:hypothetical protein
MAAAAAAACLRRHGARDVSVYLARTMELFGLILEGMGWALDVLCMGLEIYAWLRGRPNRVARKEAKAAGAEPPPRDNWNRRVILLSLAIGMLTLVLVVVRLTR